jgi:flagellar protein FlgJ
MTISADMSTAPVLASTNPLSTGELAPPNRPANVRNDGRFREAFDDFVGQTFYTQLLSQMRKTVDKPAYFHGGQGEEIFQGQLDQVLAEELSAATADQFSGPMFDLVMLGRRSG